MELDARGTQRGRDVLSAAARLLLRFIGWPEMIRNRSMIPVMVGKRWSRVPIARATVRHPDQLRLAKRGSERVERRPTGQGDFPPGARLPSGSLSY